MKLALEIDVPEETVQLFIKDGIRTDIVEAYLKEALTQSMNQMLARLPEIYAGLKSGITSFQEVIDKARIIGSNINDEAKRKLQQTP